MKSLRATFAAIFAVAILASCSGGDSGGANIQVASAPTNPIATAGISQATVTFTEPTSNGGAAITGYTVISNPVGGVDSNAGSSALSHLVIGLTNGVSYTFTVIATNLAGNSVQSNTSNSVTLTVPKGGVWLPTSITTH